MFQITGDEFNRLRSQIVTLNHKGGARYLPYAFTEPAKRNIKCFPSDFMFQFTEEVDLMVSQNAIPSRLHPGGSFPSVLESGVATSSADVPVKEDAGLNALIAENHGKAKLGRA